MAERADRSLSEILDEWDGDAPLVVDLLAPVAEHIDPGFLSDQWTHHQDVRGAVGSPGDRDDGRARFLVQRLIGVFSERGARAELDPVVVDVGSGEATTGAGRVRVDAFEFARAGVGRRSPAQMASWD